MAPQDALLALVGFVAGAVNTIAGGGSLLTLPALVVLGLEPGVANATNRVAVLLQSAVGAGTLVRGAPEPVRWPWGRLTCACLGAAAGAALASRLSADALRTAIGGVMLVMLVVLVVEPKRFLEPRPAAAGWIQGVTFFALGLHGGFVQAGVGIFLLVGGVWVAGEDLVRANVGKNLLVLAFTLPALAVFAAHGLVAWGPGLVLAAGAMLGGFVGARLTLRRGARFVRWVLAGAVLAGAVRLLVGG